VGATQVVETVNIAFAVWDKTSGHQIMAPRNIRTLYMPLGGQCANGNLSDPVVNYDKVAGRWVITMIAFNGSFSQNDGCVAVSTSSDATGAYHLYDFNYHTTLPDYPKVGVWPDAYYITTDSYPHGGGFAGVDACAMDRTKMLAGQPATSVCFQRTAIDYSMLPADVDGATAPPAGSPNYQVELHSATSLYMYKFHVDFAHPTNSTYTGPVTITVPSYSQACNGLNCVREPSPGEVLDSQGDRLMFRLAYRNFGDHEALVANHAVKTTGTGHADAAVRWYEIRSPRTTPVVYQSGTLGGGTSPIALWMGSMAMDKKGDIALGYSKSSTTLDPSIEYVGRVPSDPLGTMESPNLIFTGTGVQRSGGQRWGDYSSMAIDPSDDCTFWYAQEYIKVTGREFYTRLASFKFTTCQ
jgi:hypothetical protein